LQVPFSALGLVPENGSAINFAQSIGVHRANDFFMFGRKLTAQELLEWGLINRVFPVEGFHENVKKFLEAQLEVNDAKVSHLKLKALGKLASDFFLHDGILQTIL
jgi:peroxisomal 3,2-trans-enoyl-CoA isomerase